MSFSASCSTLSNSSLDLHSEGSYEHVEALPAATVRPKPFRSDTERPCGHNHWTKQTKKRGKLVLRCDVCQCVWKTRPEAHTKCAAFHAGRCEQGDACPHPHIYARRELLGSVRRRAQRQFYKSGAATMNPLMRGLCTLPPATINPVACPQQPAPVILPCHQQERTFQQQQQCVWTHNPYAS